MSTAYTTAAVADALTVVVDALPPAIDALPLAADAALTAAVDALHRISIYRQQSAARLYKANSYVFKNNSNCLLIKQRRKWSIFVTFPS